MKLNVNSNGVNYEFSTIKDMIMLDDLFYRCDTTTLPNLHLMLSKYPDSTILFDYCKNETKD